MRLIKGSDLSPDQREQVWRAFVHRHIAVGEGRYYATDEMWLHDRAFYFTKANRLSRAHKWAPPHYLTP